MLEAFLNSKPLYYDEIDYSRMPRVYDNIKKSIKISKIIHIIGTNGKGTTGRFLASALYSLGFSVGHYTSPHIRKFNERIWFNGAEVSDDVLNKSHKELVKLLDEKDADSLSYFEYTTLLAIFIYQDLDYVVLEAGLGGEYDATSVFDNVLTLVTPIDIDHEAFLGSDIKSIAKTKINAVSKYAIFAKQVHKEVYDTAKAILDKKDIQFSKYDRYISKDDEKKIDLISKSNNLEVYLEENLTLGICALKYFGLTYEVKDFKDSRLFGRLSILNENIIIDVGHNILAAKRIYESLKEFKYTLVYNSYKDKNYREILTILKPIIEDVEIMDVDDVRIEAQGIMKKALADIGFEYKKFISIKSNKKYLVFGSFSVAEAFLKVYSE